MVHNNLKEARKKAKLTQAGVAKKANITTRVYQYYEAGKRTPHLYTAQLIAKALHTTVEELFPLPASPSTGKDKPNSSQENK